MTQAAPSSHTAPPGREPIRDARCHQGPMSCSEIASEILPDGSTQWGVAIPQGAGRPPIRLDCVNHSAAIRLANVIDETTHE